MSASEDLAIAIATARRAYAGAGKLLDQRTAERETAKRALADAQANMERADDFWNLAASAVDKTFEALRQLVDEARADDPPEVDPEDAEAQRIAETYADAAAEMRAAEAEGWRMP